MGASGRGLTEAEARARLAAGQSNTTRLASAPTRDLALRESVFTIFHLNMVGLVVIQVLMGVLLGALITLLLGLATIGIRILQDAAAARRVRAAEHTMRPRSTVVRDGRAKRIDSDQIVVGDLVFVGPGDQFQADGLVVGSGAIVVDTVHVTGQSGFQRLEAGDEVLAGSHCASGRGTFLAQRVGGDRLVHSRMTERTAAVDQTTPLERLIARILFALFILVLIFVAILLAKYFRLDVGVYGDALVDAVPVIFSLLPTGLYLMILKTYATGTADLARMGAVVHSARSVESLAESNVICFTDVELLSGTAVELTPLPSPGDKEDWPSAPQMRQMLGDFARNVATPTPISEAIARSFEGEERAVRREESHLATLGWVALAFDDPDDANLYVLAEPRVLGPHLAASGVDALAAHTGEQGSEDAGDATVVHTLVLAWRADDLDVSDAGGEQRLPDGLVPLCTIGYGRRIRPQAIQVVRDFVAAGVRIKVFSPRDPGAVIAALREAGLSAEDEAQLLTEGGLSRHQLESTPRSQWPRLVQDFRLFGGLLPEQVGEVVRLLRRSGKHVTVVGDGLTDLPALQEANLAVAQPASAQAALGQADIVLLDHSADALLRVLRQGQAMVRGLLDLMKLNLTLVLCSALLIIDVRLFGVGFPYQGGQGSIISILAVTAPSMLLPLWARHGTVDSSRYRRILARFVVPAGVSLSLAAFGVYLLFLGRTATVAAAQLAVTYTLLYSGLVLSVLIQPPWGRPRRELGAQPGDWRTTIMAGCLGLCATLAPLVPTFRRWFSLQLMAHPLDYLTVGLAVAIWAVVLHAIWRVLPRV